MTPHFRRSLTRGLTYALAVVLVPVLAGAAGLAVRIGKGLSVDQSPPPSAGALTEPPAHDPSKRTAVVLAANSGTEGSDFLAPYIALASVVDTYPHQGTVTINTVAPERAVVLSQHGLALVPRWSFADTGCQLGQVLVYRADRDRALASCTGDTFHRAVPRVANREHPWQACLEGERRPLQRPGLPGNISTSEQIPAVVALDGLG